MINEHFQLQQRLSNSLDITRKRQEAAHSLMSGAVFREYFKIVQGARVPIPKGEHDLTSAMAIAAIDKNVATWKSTFYDPLDHFANDKNGSKNTPANSWVRNKKLQHIPPWGSTVDEFPLKDYVTKTAPMEKYQAVDSTPGAAQSDEGTRYVTSTADLLKTFGTGLSQNDFGAIAQLDGKPWSGSDAVFMKLVRGNPAEAEVRWLEQRTIKQMERPKDIGEYLSYGHPEWEYLGRNAAKGEYYPPGHYQSEAQKAALRKGGKWVQTPSGEQYFEPSDRSRRTATPRTRNPNRMGSFTVRDWQAE